MGSPLDLILINLVKEFHAEMIFFLMQILPQIPASDDVDTKILRQDVTYNP